MARRCWAWGVAGLVWFVVGVSEASASELGIPALRCAACGVVPGSGDGAAVASASVPERVPVPEAALKVRSSGALDGLVLGGFAEASVLGILSAFWSGFGLLVGSPILFQVGFAALVVSAAQFAATFSVSLFDAARGPVPGAWGDDGRRRLQSMWPIALAFPGLAHLLSGRTAHGLWVLDLFGGGLLLAALSPVLLAAGAGVVGLVILVGLGLSAVVWVASFLDAATAGALFDVLPNFEDVRKPGGGADADVDVRRSARPVDAW